MIRSERHLLVAIGFAVEWLPLRLETWSFQVRWLAAARRMRQGSTTA
jgi:hypothetical protein